LRAETEHLADDRIRRPADTRPASPLATDRSSRSGSLGRATLLDSGEASGTARLIQPST
jgi:hypothetical protein